MKATADQLNALAGQYDEATVPGSIVLPAARWWDVQSALQELAELRSQTGSAKAIVATVCAQHENPYLSARDPHILQAFDEVLASLKPVPAAAPVPKPAIAVKPAPAPPAPAPTPQPEKDQSTPNA
jgi:hypothetical protein